MTVTGRVPALLLLGLVPVVLRPVASTVWMWAALISLVVLADWWSAPRPSDLRMTRSSIGPVRMRETTSTTLLVHNIGRRRATALLRDAWQPSAGARENRHRLVLAAGDRVLLTTDLCPTRRGDLLALGVTLRTRGALGLACRQETRPVAGTLRSLPSFESRKHLPSRLARLRELDGRSAVRVRGQGTEFDSLREYVNGDDVRAIDWRASVRSRNIVVRTWQPERDRRVVLVLDTSRTSAGRVQDVPRLDSAMDAAQLLAALATRAGDRVDLIAGDRRVRRRLRMANPRASAAMADALADLHPEIVEADWRGLAAAVTQVGRQRALVVLLTPLEPSVVEESMLPVLAVLTRHHRVVVASVKDPTLAQLAATRSSTSDVYTAAAAEQVGARRERTAELLRRLGVDVLDEDAQRLPPVLADHYLMLKATGRL